MKLENYEVHLPSYSIGDTYAKYYEATISSHMVVTCFDTKY